MQIKKFKRLFRVISDDGFCVYQSHRYADCARYIEDSKPCLMTDYLTTYAQGKQINNLKQF